jgi:hypothetical protein
MSLAGDRQQNRSRATRSRAFALSIANLLERNLANGLTGTFHVMRQSEAP